MEDGRIIAKAYAKVERLADFRPAELRRYRRERLERYRAVPGLVRRFLGGAPVRMIDVGSGSSAMAYRLQDDGLLAGADCLEPSPARHRFAERWRLDEGREGVRNRKTDALAFSGEAGGYDAVFCIDHTFAYLAVAYLPSDLRRLIRGWLAALRPGGCAFVQVTLYPKVRRALAGRGLDKLQTFSETPRARFRFNLNEFRLLPARRIGVRSVYIAADGAVLEKEEVSRLFTRDELEALFHGAGFALVGAFRDAGMEAYRDGDDSVLLVLRKPGRRGSRSR